MNLSRLFIIRPIMTGLVMATILIFGVMSYRNLPVSDLPNVDFPTIQVSAGLPGANPETMAASVATPLEKQFSTISGLDSMSSTSGPGSTRITLQFALNRDIDAAAQDVQAAIAQAQGRLPPDMPSPPSSRKVNPADSPIFLLALSSPTLPLSTVDEYAQTYISQRISMLPGVAQVSVFGSQKYAVRIKLNPKSLAARSIGLDEVADAVNNANVNLPTGGLQGARQAFTIQAGGQLMKAENYRPLVVAYRNGAPVRLSDLGEVVDSVENDRVAGWFNRTRAVVLAVQRQPGTNTVAVSDSIKKLLPTFEAELPPSVNLEVLFDRSVPIRNSAADVKFTLLLTVFLVIAVIFFFLRNASATIIPGLALPISIVGTFSVMYLMGFNIDNLSLMALTLSVGFVVDDAIVMLENIFRHIEHGERPWDAALKGSAEIGFTIASMTLSLVAVFIPVLFMAGLLGRLLNEFAVTISVAILISGLVSLTLTPMLCSRFLHRAPKPAPDKSKDVPVSGALGEGGPARAHDVVIRFYERSLRLVLKRRRLTMGISAVILVATGWLFYRIPKGFLPGEDIGLITGGTEAAQGTSFEAMKAYQLAVAAVVAQDPNVEAFMTSAGSGGTVVAGSSNTGNLRIRLKPRDKRRLSVDQVIAGLRPKLAAIPGVRTYLTNPPPIQIGGMQSKSQYQFTLQSPDTALLYQYAALMENKMRDLPGLQDVTTDLQISNPQVNVAIDRDKAATLGITVRRIEQALYTAYGSRQVSTIFAPNNDYNVIVELLPEYQTDPSVLSQLYVRSSSGTMVPLRAVCRLEQSFGPLNVSHVGQLPAVTLSFNLKTGVALGDAIDSIKKLARETLPGSITTSFQGVAQVFQSSMAGLSILLVLAVLVIYIVLGILYESLIHPLTILSALPFAGFGALLTLLIFRQELNLYAFVGIIMLVGLVKKNGIMMIDFALDAERTEGKDPETAIFEACLVRFRPIMMTTMCALMGTLVIALGIGAGGEARRPLGLAVVGGLLFSQLLTLYVTPVVYLYLDAFQKHVRSIGLRRSGRS